MATAAMSRDGTAGIDRDRRVAKLPGLARQALSEKDVARSVDDGHVGHAVAVQVSDEGRVCGTRPTDPGWAN